MQINNEISHSYLHVSQLSTSTEARDSVKPSETTKKSSSSQSKEVPKRAHSIEILGTRDLELPSEEVVQTKQALKQRLEAFSQSLNVDILA